MTFGTILRTGVLVGLQALIFPFCMAGLVTYTNVSDFNAAVSSGFHPPHLTNFESLASATIIPTGTLAEGITFDYDLGASAFQMQVGSTFDTTSAPNYLGTTGDDAFLSGDQFTMTFTQAEQAVGLFVISGGIDLAGDYGLSVAQGGVASSASTDSTFGTLADGGAVYFLGLVETDASQAFTSATFTSLDGLGIPFNIDDIVTAATEFSHTSHKTADESSTLGLFLSACAGLLFLRRRHG